MPIPAGTCKVILYGTFGSGDIWETGFSMIDTGVTSASLASALANIIAGTLGSSDASGAARIMMQNLVDDFSKWLGVRVYAYVTGGTKADFIGEYVLPQPVVGGKTVTKPNQCALVLTLRTDLAGRSHRGRMYLPATGAEIDTADGQVLQTELNTVLAGWVTGFSDINESSTGEIVVTSVALDANTPITSLTLDSKMDIRRSRAKQEVVLRRANGTVAPHS